MRVIIAGSRTITNAHIVSVILNTAPFMITTILSGCAPGPDTFAIEFGRWNEIEVEKYPADWANKGIHAGLIRNNEMAKKADALIAIWDGKSKGTYHMIKAALHRKLSVYVEVIK